MLQSNLKYYAPDHRGGAPRPNLIPQDTSINDINRSAVTVAKEILECVGKRNSLPTSSTPISACEEFIAKSFPSSRPTLLRESALDGQTCIGALVKMSNYWRSKSCIPFDLVFKDIDERIEKIIGHEIKMLEKLPADLELKPGVKVIDLISMLKSDDTNGINVWKRIKIPLVAACDEATKLQSERRKHELNRENAIIRGQFTAPKPVITNYIAEEKNGSPTGRFFARRDGDQTPVPKNVKVASDPTRSLRISVSRILGGIVGGLGIPGAVAVLSRIPEKLMPGDLGFMSGFVQSLPNYFASNNILNFTDKPLLVDLFTNILTNHVTQVGFFGALAGVVGMSLRKYLLPPYGTTRSSNIKPNGVETAKWNFDRAANLKLLGVSMCVSGVLISLGPILRGPFEMFALQGSGVFMTATLLSFMGLRALTQFSLLRNNIIESNYERKLDKVEKSLDQLAPNFRRSV